MDGEWKTFDKNGVLESVSYYQVGDSVGNWLDYDKRDYLINVDSSK